MVAGAAVRPAAWAQFRNGPAQTGYNAAERALTPTNVKRLRAAWSFPTSQPSASDGREIWSTEIGGRPAAFALADGKKLWKAHVANEEVTSSPSVVNGAGYLGADRGMVTAFRKS